MAILTAQEIRDRARSEDIRNTQLFTDEDLDRYVAEFQEIAEDFCGVAFEPRSATSRQRVTRVTYLVLAPHIVSVESFTIGGTASTGYDLECTRDLDAGILPLTGSTSGVIEVTYTHGFETCPAMVERACVQYVRATGLRDDSNAGRDVVTQGFEGGTTRYATPDKYAGRPTGYIEVDRLLMSAPMYRTALVR